jgi:polyisoprenyl-phosphate glycosyltransferase
MPHISIVSPVYRAESIVHLLVEQVILNIEPITSDYEIILVEDGSPDNSWEAINNECSKNSRVKGIKLSRNFGQHYAITAGIEHATGEWIVVMDCDLQDRPEEIKNLYQKAAEGFDIVLARRVERKDPFFKRLSSKSFYMVLSYLTGTSQDPRIANFGIYHRKVIDSINKLREPIRYFPTMVKWVGFRKTLLDVDHGTRASGTTSYNWSQLFRLAMDIILVNSDKPIKLIFKAGFIIALLSLLIGIYIIYNYLINKITVQGYTSLLVSIWFIGGMIMFILGLIGLYVGKTFEGVKNRPIYLADKKVNI